MVEIVEEPDEQTSGAGSSTPPPPPPRAQYTSISQYVSANTLDCVLFVSRVLTVFFALNYMLPFIGLVPAHSAYYKIFAASAATFALRLHMRIRGQIALNAEFMQRLVIEDAFHYLIYSIVFLMATPVSMAALPITIYAALHAATFFTKAMRETGHNVGIVPKIEQFTSQQTQNALGIIACSEIFLVPLLVSLIFSGKGSLLLPFVYYRFLSLRYASRRNPSTRQAFAQMRGSLQNVATSASCPSPIRSFIHRDRGGTLQNIDRRSRQRGHLEMAFPSQLLISMGVKIVIIILTIVTLILLDPSYVTAYISINYEIVIIYLVSALTLLYCIVSILMAFLLAKRGDDTPLTNCAFSEIIFATAGIMGWLIIIGIGGTISQRTIIETGERFGWIGALAGLNMGCFIVIFLIFLMNVFNEKVMQRNSRFQKYDRGYVQ
ncbi:unnamed protein product [Caenorhabditis sp. 36 PRJEB53466]|nr:unnamed protein product [Caenorhabditis sp. 36 PRJEB53466]